MELAEAAMILSFAGQEAGGSIAMVRGNSDSALASHLRKGDSYLPCRQWEQEGKPGHACVPL